MLFKIKMIREIVDGTFVWEDNTDGDEIKISKKLYDQYLRTKELESAFYDFIYQKVFKTYKKRWKEK